MNTLCLALFAKRPVGYTLLELLVVLVIIGIVTSMAMLTVGHNDNKQLQVFAQELAQTLTLAEEQALLQPTTLGLSLTANSFRYYEYRQKAASSFWEPLTDPELGLHQLPSDLQLSLQIADKAFPLEQKSIGQQRPGRPPAILISTNGTLTPFTMLIGKKNKTPRYELIGHADGTITSQVYKG